MRFCCGKILEVTFVTSSQHSCVVLEPLTDTAPAIYIYTQASFLIFTSSLTQAAILIFYICTYKKMWCLCNIPSKLASQTFPSATAGMFLKSHHY